MRASASPASQVDPERLAVVIGTGIGGAVTLLDQDDLLEGPGLRKVSPLTVPMLMPNGPAAWVGLEFKARASVHSPVSACASGAEALAWAVRMLRAGEADVVIAGGAEACITGITVAGFVQARTLSQRNDEPERASRPFDAERDGFVLGEGAGIMILERAEHAAARGATVHGRIAGFGITADGYHITGPDPEGSGQKRAMTKAVADAGLTAADIDHVNCHATSTVAGDPGEAKAVQQALGDHVVLDRAEVVARAHRRRGGRDREHRHAAVDPRRGHPRHAQPGEARPRCRAGRRGGRAPQGRDRRRAVQLLRVRRAQRGGGDHQGMTAGVGRTGPRRPARRVSRPGRAR